LSSVGSAEGDEAAIAAANLGPIFAQAGNRVVLVDAQVQNPTLTQVFEAGGKAGLSDLMASRSSEAKLTPVRDVADMLLLPAGQSAEKPGAMLNPGNLARLLQELQKEADIVIVAGPPIAGVAESLILASQVNGVVLVARYGEAHSKVINDVAESLKSMDVQLAGVIFEHNVSSLLPTRSPKRLPAVATMEPTTTGPADKSNLS
jgi:capsular exopolysaccharide synthesis family protein